METIQLGSTGRVTTRLGFGCASLMGAIGRKESLGLLEAAFEAGIRHFDVAPMYGYGAAEACVGEFLRGHRADVTVTTKYGIPPPKNQGLVSLARKIVVPVLKRVPALKTRLARAATAVAAPTARASFTAEQARLSLERSLVALQTEHIDVWLLHDVLADELTDEGLLRFLEDAVASGKAGMFGVGTHREAIARLEDERPAFCGVEQYEWSVFHEAIGETKAFRFHHRSLTENFRNLHAGLVENPEACARWSEVTGFDLREREALARLMLKAALEENPASVVLFSSKNHAHIEENVSVAGSSSLSAAARRLYGLVQSEGIPGKIGAGR